MDKAQSEDRWIRSVGLSLEGHKRRVVRRLCEEKRRKEKRDVKLHQLSKVDEVLVV